MAIATPPRGHCVCSHPQCKAHSGNCTAPEAKPVKIAYKGEGRGEYRFCRPCKDEWKAMEDMDIQDVVPVIL